MFSSKIKLIYHNINNKCDMKLAISKKKSREKGIPTWY